MERIIVHETGHHYQWQKSEDGENIINSWFFLFGETDLASRDRIVKNPEQTVTEYGKKNPQDDFCECLVAALYDKEKIMVVAPEKYQYILNNVLLEEPVVNETSIIKQGDITLPRLPDKLTYKIIESNIVIGKKDDV